MFQPNRKLKLWIQTDHWPLFEKEGKHSSRTPEILAWSLMLLFILCVTELWDGYVVSLILFS